MNCVFVCVRTVNVCAHDKKSESVNVCTKIISMLGDLKLLTLA